MKTILKGRNTMKSRKEKQEFAVKISVLGQEPFFRRLDRAVLTVGNHPKCEIRLPENYVSRIVAVIQTSPGAVVLHNKSGHSFLTDSGEMAPNQSAAWFDGQTVEINSFVRMALIAKIKPALNGPIEQSDAQAQGTAVFTPKTVFCIAASFILVASKLFETLAPGEPTRDPMQDLVVQAQHARVDDPVKRQISFLLQEARISWLRYGNLDSDRLKAASRLLVQERIRRRNGTVDEWYDQAYSLVQLLLKHAGNES